VFTYIKFIPMFRKQKCLSSSSLKAQKDMIYFILFKIFWRGGEINWGGYHPQERFNWENFTELWKRPARKQDKMWLLGHKWLTSVTTGKKNRARVVHSSSGQLNYVIWTPASLTSGNLSIKKKGKKKREVYFILPQFPCL